MRIGVDIGAVTIGVAVLRGGELISTYYHFHNGDIRAAMQEILGSLELDAAQARIGFTGRAARTLYKEALDDVIATIEGVKWMINGNPRCILMIGGESFLLIELKDDGTYKSHEINTDCASGTGVFLEQQARRLGLDIEEFAQFAADFQGLAPAIATRCAVFARSDLIHSQQQGYSLKSIAAGLCDGVAQSVVDTIIKGKELQDKVYLVGGAAKNKRLVSALANLLDNKIVVLNQPEIVPALGAALQANRAVDIHTLCYQKYPGIEKNMPLNPALTLKLTQHPAFEQEVSAYDGDVEVNLYENLEPGKTYDVYLGLDIGSTSTKLAAASEDQVLLGLYTYTKSAPVRAVQSLFSSLARLEEKFNIKFNWLAAGTTGSGRQIIGKLIGADLVINEISAHARAAIFLDPEVDTIIEIGGQDSKFIRLQKGAVVQAIMNYICAAGTGSFIEEQAEKLKVPLKSYAELAMGRRGPVISDRCTVYMERDLSRLLSEGWPKEELLASVLHSIRDNYLMRVVGQAKIGQNIYFQGATARNRALVAAFETALQKPIKVSRFCHLTGAYGVCLLLKERNIKKTGFFGLEFSSLPYRQSAEICDLCRNKCKITLVEAGDCRAAWGFMCGRDYEDKQYVARHIPFDSVVEIHQRCLGHEPKPTKETKGGQDAVTIGLPQTLPLVEFLPLWQRFFTDLGFKVVVSPQEKEMLRRGKNLAQTEFCAPILIAHGHIDWLKKRGTDYIFFPIMLHGPKTVTNLPHSFFCYYTTYISTLVKNSPVLQVDDKLLSPLLDFRQGVDSMGGALYLSLKRIFAGARKISRRTILECFKKSLDQYLVYQQSLKGEGKRILSMLDKEKTFAILLLGRPYNIFDPSLNQNLPDLIRQYNCRVLTQDMLPLDGADCSCAEEYLAKVHWYYGKQIMRAAGFAAKNPRLFPVYITNFRCSPDAFILNYFKDMMERLGKPYLIVQLDELGSAVGYQTRIEAALESFRNWAKGEPRKGDTYSFVPLEKGRTWILPHLDDVNTALGKAVFQRLGYEALVAEETPEAIVQGLKLVGGGECVPTAALIGSILSSIKKHRLDPRNTAVILPTSFIPCNFPQIPLVMYLGFRRAGFGELKIFTTAAAGQKEPLGVNLGLMKAFITASLIHQMVAKVRPYEVHKGETEAVCLEEVERLSRAIAARQDWETSFGNLLKHFANIRVDRSDNSRPLVIMLGDLYVVWNKTFNCQVEKAIEAAGGEVLPSNFIDIFHFGNLNAIELHSKNGRFIPLISGMAINAFVRHFDLKFRRMASPILGCVHPLFDRQLFRRLRELGIPPELKGETPINLAKILYYLHHFQPDAVVHINPLYCCPGDVTSALSAWIEDKFHIPMINLFYDGINNPNDNLKPYIHYLRQTRESTPLRGPRPANKES